MGGIKLSVHPLFFVLGFYYALTGQIFIFIIYTITAIVHEIGHSYCASQQGYKLNKIVLMPFGAVVYGNIDGLSLLDELKIALAGPFVNLFIGIIFVAFWWIYPESYAFTDIAAQANFSMALINFIPAYPLDGGRVFMALLSLKHKKETAQKIVKATGFVFFAILIILLILSIKKTINISLLFFALFIFAGTISKEKENKYIKLTSLTFNKERLLQGINIKRQAVDKKIIIKKLVHLLDESSLNEIVVFSDGKPITTLSQEKLNNILLNAEIYSPLEKYL